MFPLGSVGVTGTSGLTGQLFCCGQTFGVVTVVVANDGLRAPFWEIDC